MNRKWVLLVFRTVMLTSTVALNAQDPQGPPPSDVFMAGEPLGGRMKILGFEEMHPGKVVTGAPYSAVAVTETTQTLADGTTIDRKIQANVFRDGQGRVRRETTLPVIGPLVASGKSNSFVMIHDPVAGTAFILHPDTKIADQLPAHGPGKNAGALRDKFEAHIQQEIANGTVKKDGQAHHRRHRALVLGGSPGGGEEHADRSALWLNRIHADEHSTPGTRGHALYSALGLQRPARASSRQGQHDVRPCRTGSPGSSAASAGRIVCALTIFSPEDGTPLLQLPPLLQ